MISKLIFKQTICIFLLYIRLSNCQPLIAQEEEDHLNNRVRHYLKRIELVAQNNNNKFSNELQNLITKFKYSLAHESFKEKSTLLEQQTKNLEFEDFLSTEIDKQFINEDILMELWYLNEIAPYINKDLHDEVIKLIHDLKEAYRTEEFEKKFDLYADIGENISEQFLEYFYGEDEAVPLLNAQLKYYMEYLQYLAKEFKLDGAEFQNDIQELLFKVETAKASDNKTEKANVIDLFDNLTTKFGRYLDDHFLDFNMFKFGE